MLPEVGSDMQIELIGCTGAGKSTLAEGILQACRERGIDIRLGDDFVLGQVGLGWAKGRLLRKLVLNLAALSAYLATWRAHLEIYRFAARVLSELPIGRLAKIDILRNVMKRVGIYEIIRSHSTEQQIILLDEGVLQAAHYLFVHVSARVEPDHVSAFAGLIPLPDVIVYLRQPESLLVDRTMRRGHKRIPDLSISNTTRFVRRAVATFDRLAQYPAVEDRLLVIDGGHDAAIVTTCADHPSVDLASEIVRTGMGVAEPIQAGPRLADHRSALSNEVATCQVN
jgi:thymidylate kinase